MKRGKKKARTVSSSEVILPNNERKEKKTFVFHFPSLDAFTPSSIAARARMQAEERRGKAGGNGGMDLVAINQPPGRGEGGFFSFIFFIFFCFFLPHSSSSFSITDGHTILSFPRECGGTVMEESGRLSTPRVGLFSRTDSFTLKSKEGRK